MAGDGCQVQGRPLVVVHLLEGAVNDEESRQLLKVPIVSADTGRGVPLYQVLVGFACAVPLLLILVEEVKVVVDVTQFLDDSNTPHRVAF